MERPVPVTRPTHLVNIHEAVRFLTVSPSTLYAWVWQRRIPSVRLAGRCASIWPTSNGSLRKTEPGHAKPTNSRSSYVRIKRGGGERLKPAVLKNKIADSLSGIKFN